MSTKHSALQSAAEAFYAAMSGASEKKLYDTLLYFEDVSVRSNDSQEFEPAHGIVAALRTAIRLKQLGE